MSAAIVAKEAQAKAAKAAQEQQARQSAADAAAFAEARKLENERFAHEQALAFGPVSAPALPGNSLTRTGNQLTAAAGPGPAFASRPSMPGVQQWPAQVTGAAMPPLAWLVGGAAAVAVLAVLMKR